MPLDMSEDLRAVARRGRALAGAGQGEAACSLMRGALSLGDGDAEGWRRLGDALHAAGDPQGGGTAHLRGVSASTRDPALLAAAEALAAERLHEAEQLLKARLKSTPTDVAAIRMLAELATRLARYGDAEKLLCRALALAPGFVPARHNLAVVLYRQARSAEALAEVEQLLEIDGRHPAYRNLKAAILVRIGDYEEAIAIYSAVLADFPDQPKVWMSLAHALKTVGRFTDSVAAYRRSLVQQPTLGESWWSLANLKTFRFDDTDVAALQSELDNPALSDDDRFHFEFALGKALEDRGEFASSFAHYARGNRLRRAALEYDPEELADQRRRAEALFDRDFFGARSDGGDAAPDPIFVVGIQRSGSTLVEQILASHPLVEGTMELPDLPAIARKLAGKRKRGEASRYPEILADLDADERAALGRDYLELTRIQRKTERPYFIDKLPNNFAHVGLIQLILPNARIVDVRRHPLACCFSCFKQHFARGQAFSYDLTELGRYYVDYVGMMEVIDRALPGRVRRVIYERLVADLESEVRALLADLGLPFDPACLAFHETKRAVRTPSAEQVRQPIYGDGIDQWRNYQPWLAPLERALGDVIGRWNCAAQRPLDSPADP